MNPLSTAERTGRSGYAVIWISSSSAELRSGRWSLLTALCRSLVRDKLDYETAVEDDKLIVRWCGPMRPARKARKARSFTKSGSSAPLTHDHCLRKLPDAERAMRSWRARLPGLMRENCSNYGELLYARDVSRQFREWEGAAREAPEMGLDAAAPLQPFSRFYLSEKARRRRIGRAVARIAAMNGGTLLIDGFSRDGRPRQGVTCAAYEILDRAVGHPVIRLSALSGYARMQGYLQTVIQQYAGGGSVHRQDRSAQVAPFLDAYLEAKADLDYWHELEILSGERDKWKPGIGPDGA